MIKFEDSYVCKGHKNCALCRSDTEKGCNFRNLMSKNFVWDDAFSCPLQLEIGTKELPQINVLPRKPCGKCNKNSLPSTDSSKSIAR